MDLVSELCGKLRDLERSEEEHQHQQVVDEENKIMASKGNPVSASRGAAATASAGARNKESSSATGNEKRGASKSNPYYQMFPALSGNMPPPSNSSSRATSISGVMSESSTSSNWGGQQQQKAAKWRMEVERELERNVKQQGQPEERMSNQELQHATAGGGHGGGANNKRKNKKRRTNGESELELRRRGGGISNIFAEIRKEQDESYLMGGRREEDTRKWGQWEVIFKETRRLLWKSESVLCVVL